MSDALREAAQQALEALELTYNVTSVHCDTQWNTITALRAALEQQEQKPVAWQGVHDNTDLYYRRPPQADVRPLYTHPDAKDCGEAGHDEGRCGNASCMAHPPRREWQGLTEQRDELLEACKEAEWNSLHLPESVRAKLEAAIKKAEGA